MEDDELSRFDEDHDGSHPHLSGSTGGGGGGAGGHERFRLQGAVLVDSFTQRFRPGTVDLYIYIYVCVKIKQRERERRVETRVCVRESIYICFVMELERERD